MRSKSASPSSSTSAPPQRTVVLVDADRPFRRALADILRDDGYQVFECADSSDVPPLGQMDTAIALVVSNRMQDGDGLAFADRFRTMHRCAPVVVTAPYITAALESEVAARPETHLLCKPIDYATLATLLEKRTDAGQVIQLPPVCCDTCESQR